MKRSTAVTLTLVPAFAAACNSTPPAPDPCLPASYSAEACQYAIDHRGYYHDGYWVPHVYGYPYIFYSGGYNTYILRGGRPGLISSGRYSPSLARVTPTMRGGFGSSGAARSASRSSFRSGGSSGSRGFSFGG